MVGSALPWTLVVEFGNQEGRSSSRRYRPIRNRAPSDLHRHHPRLRGDRSGAGHHARCRRMRIRSRGSDLLDQGPARGTVPPRRTGGRRLRTLIVERSRCWSRLGRAVESDPRPLLRIKIHAEPEVPQLRFNKIGRRYCFPHRVGPRILRHVSAPRATGCVATLSRARRRLRRRKRWLMSTGRSRGSGNRQLQLQFRLPCCHSTLYRRTAIAAR